MPQSEIDAVRALLSAKPRPVGWEERRRRIEEVGAVWPVADDVKLEPVDLDGVPGEWSIVPGADASRVLIYFHGGGYCSGSIVSHRRLVTEAGRAGGLRTLAVDYRLAPEHPFPAARDDALTVWRRLRREGYAAKQIAVGGDSAGANLTLALVGELKRAGEDLPGCLWLLSPWVDLDHVGSDAREQKRGRSAHSERISGGAGQGLCPGWTWTGKTRAFRLSTQISRDCRRP